MGDPGIQNLHKHPSLHVLYCMFHWSHLEKHGMGVFHLDSHIWPHKCGLNTNPEGGFYAGSYEGNRRSVSED